MTEQGLPAEPGLSLAHIGINCADEESARQTAAALCGLLGLEYRPGEKSIFAGSIAECMKSPYRGQNGHIALAVSDLEQAVCCLQGQGVAFDETTRTSKAIYLRDEIGGFAIHLLQRG